jgi:hypothetical protein
MTPAKVFFATLCGLAVLGVMMLGSASSSPGLMAQNWGEAADGLQLAISLDRARTAESKVPKFVVEMRNSGSSDLTLNLGFALGNGKSQFPAAITLNLGDADGKFRRLGLRGPAIVAGRLDALVLPLPAGATFSVPVDLNQYWAPVTQEFDFNLKRGSYAIEAQFTGKPVDGQQANDDLKGFALMNYWQGAVTSNRLRFEVPAR